MKLNSALIFTILTHAIGSDARPIAVSSATGKLLVQEARQLQGEDGGENNENIHNYYNYDISWMQDYSLKFIGCHHVAQWNDASEDNTSSVRIQTHRYIRFRLCPADSCSAKKSLGCSSAYGDYVVDMETYVKAHVEHEKQIVEEECDAYTTNCDCNDGEDNAEDCFNECYYQAGMDQCVRGDQENSNDLRFLERYASCNEYKNENNKNGRNLEENNAAKYYIGPYCAEGGSKVVLGLFTDDTCTTFADDYDDVGTTSFEAMSGYSLPYSSDSLIDNNCYSCEKAANNYYQEKEIRGICTDTYQVSGKCETQLYNTVDSVNENACNWIEGIKITPLHSNGIIHAKYYHGSFSAAIAITFFAITFVALAFYIMYLRSRLASKPKTVDAPMKPRSDPVVKKSRWARFWLFFRVRSFRRKRSAKSDALL